MYVPVVGKVTVQGRPLGYGRVVFRAKQAKGVEARGEINNDGTYSLDSDGHIGVLPGEYQVFIYATKTSADSTQPPEWGASQKYAQENSGLTAVVKNDAAKQTFNFDLDP
jgi:hypothetical protein